MRIVINPVIARRPPSTRLKKYQKQPSIAKSNSFQSNPFQTPNADTNQCYQIVSMNLTTIGFSPNDPLLTVLL
jgi:hypothetical protein